MKVDVRTSSARRAAAVIVCAAGFQNFGDDEILARWMPAYSNHDVFLVSGPHIDHQVCRKIPIWELGSDAIEDLKVRLLDYPRRIVHLLGGGYCNDLFGSAPKIFAMLTSLQEIAPLIATGISFFPLTDQSLEKLGELQFAYISLRDDYACDRIDSKCRLVLGDDLLPVLQRRGGGSRSPRSSLYVNVQNQFEVTSRLEEIGRMVSRYAAGGEFENVFVCECHPGDLDVAEFIEKARTVPRENMPSLVPGPNDRFIATRFHFRMLMESCGASGIVIMADDSYYANKHEGSVRSINFNKIARLASIEEFLSSDTFPPKPRAPIRWRAMLKSIEFATIRMTLASQARDWVPDRAFGYRDGRR